MTEQTPPVTPPENIGCNLIGCLSFIIIVMFLIGLMGAAWKFINWAWT